jgi:hypothetical protein
MDRPHSTAASPSRGRWLWPIGVERRAAGSRAEAGAVPAPGGQIIRYTLPERLLGPEPADCEVVLGDDYGARVLERVLRRESWWLWWTERALLARLERRAVGIRRRRHLPESAPESLTEATSGEAPRAGDSAWVARGVFRTFGAALLPPGSALQDAVLDAGASLYSEMNPNFWIGVSARTGWSPRGLEDWCAAATPPSLSLEPFTRGVECLCMAHDGDISLGIPEAEAPRVLSALEQWASIHGVTLELRAPPEAP